MNKTCWLSVASLLFLFACKPSILYEKYEKIPNEQWYYKTTIPFEIEIEDTLQRYDLYLMVRHTNNFSFQNFWVNVNTTFPDNTTQNQNVDLPMADKTGRWFGNGFSNIKTNEILIQPNAKMPQAGKYLIEIKQGMRYEPVIDILDIGLRVEPAKINL